jgi:clan AA aspartic protease
MGLIYADLELFNSDDLALQRRGYLQSDQVRHIPIKALVDSDAYMLAINEDIAIQLSLPKLDEQLAEMADGRRVKLDIAGPVDVRFANRAMTVRAMVLPGDTEPLLGVISLEDMDVVINPRQQALVVNPQTPYIPKKPLK